MAEVIVREHVKGIYVEDDNGVKFAVVPGPNNNGFMLSVVAKPVTVAQAGRAYNYTVNSGHRITSAFNRVDGIAFAEALLKLARQGESVAVG